MSSRGKAATIASEGEVEGEGGREEEEGRKGDRSFAFETTGGEYSGGGGGKGDVVVEVKYEEEEEEAMLVGCGWGGNTKRAEGVSSTSGHLRRRGATRRGRKRWNLMEGKALLESPT